jgi:hypothetical protein
VRQEVTNLERQRNISPQKIRVIQYI